MNFDCEFPAVFASWTCFEFRVVEGVLLNVRVGPGEHFEKVGRPRKPGSVVRGLEMVSLKGEDLQLGDSVEQWWVRTQKDQPHWMLVHDHVLDVTNTECWSCVDLLVLCEASRGRRQSSFGKSE